MKHTGRIYVPRFGGSVPLSSALYSALAADVTFSRGWSLASRPPLGRRSSTALSKMIGLRRTLLKRHPSSYAQQLQRATRRLCCGARAASWRDTGTNNDDSVEPENAAAPNDNENNHDSYGGGSGGGGGVWAVTSRRDASAIELWSLSERIKRACASPLLDTGTPGGCSWRRGAGPNQGLGRRWRSMQTRDRAQINTDTIVIKNNNEATSGTARQRRPSAPLRAGTMKLLRGVTVMVVVVVVGEHYVDG